MPASARARAHDRRGGASAVPRHHRRVSGPVRPLATAGAAAAPRISTGARTRARQRTSAFERIRALPEHRVVDSLLRSRAWIVLVAVLLGGIVAMQVSLLKLNAGISRAVTASATLERQNADMQDSIARLSSGERVRAAAVANGMVSPPAGDVGFLTSRGARDAAQAAAHMEPPSAAAKALMANGGHDPNALHTDTSATTTTTTAPTASTTPAPTPTPTPDPTPPAATTSAITPQG
jgi:hypothetical protein